MLNQRRPARDLLGRVYPFALPLLLFLAVTAISHQFAVGFVAVCFVLALGRTPWKMARQRVSVLTLAVVVYAFVCLISGLWSHFGEYAGRESVKILIALAAFGLVLARTREDAPLDGLLWTLEGVLTAVSLLCVDAGSWQLLSRGFSALMKLFYSSYPLSTMGYESGIRITGIYSNANVSAGMIAFGLVIGLYLYQTASSRRVKVAAAMCLGVEALAFFLSFSMGAMAAFGLTCLMYVLCAGHGKRLGLFLLMLECVAVTVACAFAATPFLGNGSVVPVLLALVCGGIIWALDTFLGARLLSVLEGKAKAVGAAGTVLAELAVIYVALALNLTGGITLDGQLSRAVYPAAGEYTVSAQGDEAQVLIYSQSSAELMMHTNTTLYEGTLDGAAFTVPEDSKVVWFVLAGQGTLERVTLSNGTEVPLGYKLLPAFAANRLQGLRANQNFIQRLVFFQDGLKLWQASPLLGWGIGGVEGQLTAVQSFFYESKYIHNQFIQIMDEAGLLGLASFVFLLGSAVWTLLRHRKEERQPIFAMLAACLTMMTAHSLTEVVWSAQMYQVTVFCLLAVLVIQYGEPLAPRHAALAGWWVTAALWLVALVFGGFQAGTLLADHIADNLDPENMTQAQFVSTLLKLDSIDIYEDTSYKVNAMANALEMGSTSNRGTAARLARELVATEEFDACYYAAAYYYLPMGDIGGFFATCETGIRQELSNRDAWISIVNLCSQAVSQLDAEDMDDFVTGLVWLQDWLTEVNSSGRMEEITLDEDEQAFLNAAVALRESGVSGEAAQALLSDLAG